MTYSYTYGNGQWAFTISGSNATIIGANVVDVGTVIVPNTVSNNGISYTVVTIGDSVLNGDTTPSSQKTTSVSFQSPSSITSIGVNFCTILPNLTSCVIPDSVTSIATNLCGGSGASTLLLSISKNIIVNTTNLRGLLFNCTATTIYLLTPLLQDDSGITGPRVFESTYNLSTLYIISSLGTNQPITFVKTDGVLGPFPFQYLRNSTYGTLYLTTAIDNQALIGGVTGINTGVAGLPDRWTIATFSGNVPCFPAGTRILTADGYKVVESLKQQDLVVTSDGRQVPVKIYGKRIDKTNVDSAPYLIPANSLGPKTPIHDIRLSPDHAFQIRKGVWMVPHKAAKLSDKVVKYGIGEPITYFHLECPHYFRDNLVIEGGVIAESYAAGQASFKSPYKYNERIRGYTRENPSVSVKKM